MLGALPPQTFRQSQLWRHPLGEAATRLGEDTTRWAAPVPAAPPRRWCSTSPCGGQRSQTPARRRIGHVRGRTPPTPRGWGDLFEFVFQDHDVLMLYDMPAQEAESAAGAVNVDPARWFTEFSLPYPVPDGPTRPTRRTVRCCLGPCSARQRVGGWPLRRQ